MDKDVIKRLVDSYFEGRTTLEDERLLREYFRGDEVAPELEACKPLFAYFDEERQAQQMSDVQPVALLAHRRVLLWSSIAAAACALTLFMLNVLRQTPDAQSLAYIDGRKFTDIEIIRTEALNGLANLADTEDDVFQSQVEALEMFLNEDNNE